LNGAKILILGVAYKKDIEDIRESPSLKLIQLLRAKGAEISYNDPYIPEIKLSKGSLTSVKLTGKNLASADCVIIATDHSCYNINEVVARTKMVFDTRGATKHLKPSNNNVVRLGE